VNEAINLAVSETISAFRRVCDMHHIGPCACCMQHLPISRQIMPQLSPGTFSLQRQGRCARRVDCPQARPRWARPRWARLSRGSNGGRFAFKASNPMGVSGSALSILPAVSSTWWRKHLRLVCRRANPDIAFQ
jgi:hypothetical protein